MHLLKITNYWWVMGHCTVTHDPSDPSKMCDPFDPWPMTHWPIVSSARTMLLFVSNICFKYAPKWMVSSLIFQKISGEEHRVLSPEPLLPFLLGLCLQFGLRSQFMGASHLLLWLRPRSSGASRLRFGLRTRLLISEIGLTLKIYSWSRQCWSVLCLWRIPWSVTDN